MSLDSLKILKRIFRCFCDGIIFDTFYFLVSWTIKVTKEPNNYKLEGVVTKCLFLNVFQNFQRKHPSRRFAFVKTAGWKISQNLQENTNGGILFLIKMQVENFVNIHNLMPVAFFSKCTKKQPQRSLTFNIVVGWRHNIDI